MRHEAFDIGSIDVRSLSPAQQGALRRRLVREAHAARTRAIQRALARLFGRPHWLREAFRKIWAAHIRRRNLREGLAQLRGMNDQELRDIGLPRSGIRGAVFSGERDAAPATGHQQQKEHP